MGKNGSVARVSSETVCEFHITRAFVDRSLYHMTRIEVFADQQKEFLVSLGAEVPKKPAKKKRRHPVSVK